MKRLFTLTLALFCLGAQAQVVGTKYSQYPNIKAVPPNFLTLWAEPGITNWNQTYRELFTQLSSDGLEFINTNLFALASSTNLDMMNRFVHKLGLNNNPVTILGIGDSVNQFFQSPVTSLSDRLGSIYGSRGAQYDAKYLQYFPSGATSTGPVSQQPVPDINWWSGYFIIPAGATMTWTNYYQDATFQNVSSVDIYWTAHPLGGTMDLQINTGSGYSTVATLNTLAAVRECRTTNILVAAHAAAPTLLLNFIGQTGTNFLMHLVFNAGPDGAPTRRITTIYGGQGGQQIGPGFGPAILDCDSNVLWTAVRNMHPDLIVWHAKHEGSWSGVDAWAMPYIMNLFKSASPDAEVLLCGSYPVVNGLEDLTTPILKTYAVTNQCTFIDFKASAPPPDYAYTNGWFLPTDGYPGLHYWGPAYDALMEPYYSYWGMTKVETPANMGQWSGPGPFLGSGGFHVGGSVNPYGTTPFGVVVVDSGLWGTNGLTLDMHRNDYSTFNGALVVAGGLQALAIHSTSTGTIDNDLAAQSFQVTGTRTNHYKLGDFIGSGAADTMAAFDHNGVLVSRSTQVFFVSTNYNAADWVPEIGKIKYLGSNNATYSVSTTKTNLISAP